MSEMSKVLLLATVRTMISELTDRIRGEDIVMLHWESIDWDACTESELAAAKRLLHELLYAPPSRN